MALAAKIPYDHPFAGGYPGIGSQPLPTDADAIDYLSRMATADGAGVEVGVATAVDAFFRGLKATPGLFDAMKASCILCGARTLAGALVPLAGNAPSNNNFVAADYARGGATPGLVGDGSTKYLDSNRSNTDDPEDNFHASVYITTLQSGVGYGLAIAGGTLNADTFIAVNFTELLTRCRCADATAFSGGIGASLFGISRSASDKYIARANSSSEDVNVASNSQTNETIFLYRRDSASNPNYFDGRIAFYSIGEAVDLEALDDAVSALVTAIGAAV